MDPGMHCGSIVGEEIYITETAVWCLVEFVCVCVWECGSLSLPFLPLCFVSGSKVTKRHRPAYSHLTANTHTHTNIHYIYILYNKKQHTLRSNFSGKSKDFAIGTFLLLSKSHS